METTIFSLPVEAMTIDFNAEIFKSVITFHESSKKYFALTFGEL